MKHQNTISGDNRSTHPIPCLQKSDDIRGNEIIAMLYAKGTSASVVAHQNGFSLDDVFDVVNGEKMYPNIARLIAEAIGTTKEMLWPSIYSTFAKPVDMTVFVLRVTLS